MTSLLPAATGCAKSPRKKVIVVGAGIAGLSAATALRGAGIDVVVVEARSRIGGRIHTSTAWPDLPMDLGASWIHGTRGNPITELARQAGAETVETSYDSVKLHIDPALQALGLRDSGFDAAEATFERAMAWAGKQDRDVSVQTALDKVAPAASLDRVRRTQLDFYVSGTYEQEYSGGARDLSAWSVDEGEEFGGEDALFPGGYGQIVAYLAKGLDIRLNREVAAVKAHAAGVTVSFADRTTLDADRVLVTVPLGVLKAGTIAFDPPLPAPTRGAIARLGMGLLNKHWLRFDRVFWPGQFDWHEFLGECKGEWSEWVSLAKVNQTPVLLVFSAAEHAERVERQDDRAIVDAIMKTARTMFGSKVPDPVATQITRWRADPFARGSYSYYATGSVPSDRKALGLGGDERVLLAGEAQSESHPGTVHGAYLSGRDAAARIIRGIQ